MDFNGLLYQRRSTPRGVEIRLLARCHAANSDAEQLGYIGEGLVMPLFNIYISRDGNICLT